MGVTQAQFTIDDSGNLFGGSDSRRQESSVSYGAGLELTLTDRVYLKGDYIRYIDTNDFVMDSVNAGIAWRF